MSSLNQAQIIGRVGKDPEIRYMQDGSAIANISLATSEKWKDKNTGEQKEATEWHRVVMYQRLAEIAGEYVKKGALVYISGKIKTRKWTDKDGNDKYTTEIHASELKMLGKKEESDGGFSQPTQGNTQRQAPSGGGGGGGGGGGVADMDDDIPFAQVDWRL